MAGTVVNDVNRDIIVTALSESTTFFSSQTSFTALANKLLEKKAANVFVREFENAKEKNKEGILSRLITEWMERTSIRDKTVEIILGHLRSSDIREMNSAEIIE